jgi:hypothetical protein
VAKGHNFHRIDKIVFLAIPFTAADDKFASFARGNDRFDDWFSGKIH